MTTSFRRITLVTGIACATFAGSVASAGARPIDWWLPLQGPAKTSKPRPSHQAIVASQCLVARIDARSVATDANPSRS
jgi:hypothetical protein